MTKSMKKPRRPLTKDNPARRQRDHTIAMQRAGGATVREIAKSVGIHYSTVSGVLSDSDIKALVDQAARDIAAMTPTVVDNYRDFLNDGDKKIRLEATRDVAKIIGMQGSATPGVVLNLYQGASGSDPESMLKIEQRIAELMAGRPGDNQPALAAPEVIDITIDPRL